MWFLAFSLELSVSKNQTHLPENPLVRPSEKDEDRLFGDTAWLDADPWPNEKPDPSCGSNGQIDGYPCVSMVSCGILWYPCVSNSLFLETLSCYEQVTQELGDLYNSSVYCHISICCVARQMLILQDELNSWDNVNDQTTLPSCWHPDCHGVVGWLFFKHFLLQIMWDRLHCKCFKGSTTALKASARSSSCILLFDFCFGTVKVESILHIIYMICYDILLCSFITLSRTWAYSHRQNYGKKKKRFNLQAPPVYDRKVTNLFFP